MTDEKDPRRVEAGKKAAETRKQREGDQVFSDMGKKGAESRQQSSDNTGSSSADLASSEEAYDGKDPRRVEAGKKAAETRKNREGDDVFHKLGEAGAEARWGHGSTEDDSAPRNRNE